MTRDDRAAFDVCFNRLAKCGVISDLDAATKALYFDALSDLPLWAVELAEMFLRRHPVEFFRGSATWHQVADQILREQRQREDREMAERALTAAVYCTACNDTGWADAGNSRVRPCPCRATNPNYRTIQARARLGRDLDPSPAEATQIEGRVRDFKRLQGGGE